jgi:hypothetical protein
VTFDGIDNPGIKGPSGPGSVDRPGGAQPVRKSDDQHIDPAAKQKQGSDSAKISENAAEVARYQEMARLHREAYGPADRSEKLQQVRQRIQEGFYDNPDVQEKIAGGLTTAIQAGGGESDVERASRRTQEGFYDRPEVIDDTAERVVRNLMPGLPPDEEA